MDFIISFCHMRIWIFKINNCWITRLLILQGRSPSISSLKAGFYFANSDHRLSILKQVLVKLLVAGSALLDSNHECFTEKAVLQVASSCLTSAHLHHRFNYRVNEVPGAKQMDKATGFLKSLMEVHWRTLALILKTRIFLRIREKEAREVQLERDADTSDNQ